MCVSVRLAGYACDTRPMRETWMVCGMYRGIMHGGLMILASIVYKLKGICCLTDGQPDSNTQSPTHR